MRILVDGLPRSIGGIGTLILNIIEYSRNCDDALKPEFEFIIPSESVYIPFLERNGYRYYIAPPVHDIWKYRTFVLTLFSKSQYDYLWYNNTCKVNIILPRIAKQHGTKVIAHPHGVDIEETGLKRVLFKVLDRINTRRMFSMIDIPFACSNGAADAYYRGELKLRRNVAIICNGIDTERYRFDLAAREKIRGELAVEDNEIILGAVGRLTVVKNYAFIIRALSKLDAHYKMIILGVGEDHKELEELIRQLRLDDRCFLLGSKNNMSDYYSAMDFFLMPSLHEGMPLSVVEAQSSGVQCIVSDTLSDELRITDLVDYVAIDDPQKWATAISQKSEIPERSAYSRIVDEAGYGIANTYHIFKNSLGIK